MRISTLVFLLIFAGLFGHVRRHDSCQSGSRIERQTQLPVSRALQDRTRELEKELSAVDKQYRQADHSVRNLDRTIRGLQEVVRRTEKEICRCTSELCQGILKVRTENLSHLKTEMDDVIAGHRRLLALREDLVGRRVALKAKIELVKAGVFDETDLELEVPFERPSPLEALSKTALAR